MTQRNGEIAAPVFIDSSLVLTAGARIGQAFAPRILELAARSGVSAVTDAVVVAEVQAFVPSPLADLFRGIVEEIFEVTAGDWESARGLAREFPGRSPRTYLHAAVMRRRKVELLYAINGAGFEGLPGLRQLPVAELLRRSSDRHSDSGG